MGNFSVAETSRLVGRPRKISDGDTYDLIDALKRGCSISVACNRTGLPRSVFYAEMKRNEEFRDKITAAQDVMTTQATRIIEKQLLKGDINTAKWWL